MIPPINKTTRVTKKAAAAIYHIITNSFAENAFKTAKIKSNVSDHFPISILFLHQTNLQKNEVINQCKRIINQGKIEAFLESLYQYEWDTIKTHQDANEACNIFTLTFCTIYDTFFPVNKVTIKTKDCESPSITKGMTKSSKRSNVSFRNLKK